MAQFSSVQYIMLPLQIEANENQRLYAASGRMISCVWILVGGWLAG